MTYKLTADDRAAIEMAHRWVRLEDTERERVVRTVTENSAYAIGLLAGFELAREAAARETMAEREEHCKRGDHDRGDACVYAARRIRALTLTGEVGT